MERETFRTDPGVLHAVLAIMEHLAVQLLISIVPRLLVHAVKLGLLQQRGQAVGFLLLFFQLLFSFLLLLLNLQGTLVLWL